MVATNRAPVVFCPPQLTPPHLSDKGGLKPNLIPTPIVSVKTRPYTLHILGLRQPWLTYIGIIPSSREGWLLHSYLPPLQKTSKVTQAFFGDALPHVRHIQVTESNCGSQDCKKQHQTLLLCYKTMLGQLLSLSFSFCQYCLAFAFVSLLFRMVLDPLLLLFPRPHCFRAGFLFFHGCKGICHPAHPVGGENFFVGGERESLHLSPFPMARRTEKSKLSIVKARSEGHYSHLHQHPSDQLISLLNKENKVHKNIGDSG